MYVCKVHLHVCSDVYYPLLYMYNVLNTSNYLHVQCTTCTCTCTTNINVITTSTMYLHH